MERQNVRISATGRRILNNRALAEKVAQAIMAGKEKLKAGHEVEVNDSNLKVQLVTSLNDQALTPNKKK